MDVKLRDLQTTLANIEEARSFRDFLVLDIDEAHPRISETVKTVMKKVKRSVPSYKAIPTPHNCYTQSVKSMPRAFTSPLGIPKIDLYGNLFLIVLSRYTYPFTLVPPYCLLLYPAGLHV
ncbi:MAG: hypothetical protein NXY57DRAFT_1068861 [Lentinula lateritia]|nr:MAG: hypothetical protein NXY57DRAFT_1068861 [Lentinula lateritia]